MDYFNERVRQTLEMDKHSTEILSKCYSDLSHQNKPGVDKIENAYMAEDNRSEAEVCSAGSRNCKRNISNATIAQLSAQIMNLPYNKFNESILNEEKRGIYDDYDIFKKIREVYAACACKICKCITGTTVEPRKESCDCQSCKCKDCIFNNNLKINSAYSQSSSSNCDRIDQIKSEVINTRCDCEPCNCIECSQHFCRLGPDYLVQNEKKELTRKMITKNPQFQDMSEDYDHTYGTLIGRNNFPNCKRATYLNEPYGVQKTKQYRWTGRGEVPSKHFERSANGSQNYSAILKIDHPITIYQSHANNKCACSTCACIACECKGNALNCNLNKTRYEDKFRQNLGLTNSKVCECATCKCQVCSHKKQAILQPLERSKCKCDICSCIQCERDSEWKNRDCHCDQLCCENCKGGCDKCDNVYVIKKQLSISRMMRGNENPLTYQCDQYAQIMKYRARPNLKTSEKTKYGKIYYVSNYKPDKPMDKILKPVRSILKENRLDKEKEGKKAVRKDSDRNMDIKRKQRKSTQVDNTSKKITPRHSKNSRTSKTSVKNISVSVLPACLSKGVPVASPGNTCLHSFYPACRSTQTMSKSSTSVLSYKNNGCCTHTISLPDTNIVKVFTRTTPDSYFYDITKDNNYQRQQHNIYHFSEIKSDLHNTNASNFLDINENNNDNNDKKNVDANFLFDTFEYLTKNYNVEHTKQTKVHNESVQSALQKAKQFTLYLKKILKKYEKANSEFESVSGKLKKLHYIMFNNANKNYQVCRSINKSQPVCNKRNIDESFLKNNQSCESIIKHIAAMEEKIYPINSCERNGPIVERFETINYSTGIINHKKETQLVEIAPSTIDTLKNNQINKHVEIDNKTEIVTDIHKLQGNVDKLRVLTKDRQLSIQSVGKNKLQVWEDNIEEHEHAANQVELLREKKIQNILKQNIVPDLFTEQVSSPRSTSLMEPKDHLTFNYHTKTLMRSTFSTLPFYYK